MPFTGEENSLYTTVNVEGTRRLLRSLQSFEVEQFVYASTMLVHAPCRPGEHIDESQPIAPAWAYPKSKAAAEAVIEAEHGHIPYVILRLAGVYDEKSLVPTLAQQIARIHGREFQSYFYGNCILDNPCSRGGIVGLSPGGRDVDCRQSDFPRRRSGPRMA